MRGFGQAESTAIWRAAEPHREAPARPLKKHQHPAAMRSFNQSAASI